MSAIAAISPNHNPACGEAGVKQAPALGQTDLLRAVGEEADLADARDVRRHDVEQDAVDEGLGGQGDCSDDAAMLAVSIGEADVAVGHRREPIVRDREAVGEAPEVVEGGCGPATRRLRLDDPGLATQGADPCLTRRRCLNGRERHREDQSLLLRRRLEPRQEPAAEGPR